MRRVATADGLDCTIGMTKEVKQGQVGASESSLRTVNGESIKNGAEWSGVEGGREDVRELERVDRRVQGTYMEARRARGAREHGEAETEAESERNQQSNAKLGMQHGN